MHHSILTASLVTTALITAGITSMRCDVDTFASSLRFNEEHPEPPRACKPPVDSAPENSASPAKGCSAPTPPPKPDPDVPLDLRLADAPRR